MEVMKRKINKGIRRGDIYYAILKGEGSQQSGIRPVVIYSNDLNNEHCPTINVLPISKKDKKLIVHVRVEGCGLKETSTVLTEQITTINKIQLRRRIGRLSSVYLDSVDDAVDIQLGRTRYKRGAA